MSDPHTEIPALLGQIRKLDQDISIAEQTLAKLECIGGQDTIDVVMGGLIVPLTHADRSTCYQAAPVKENNDLRLACINAQKRHLVRLRSKAEGLRWKVRELSKQL